MISFRSIKLDLTPRVFFHDGLASLTQQSRQDLPHEQGRYGRTPGEKQSETSKTRSAVQPRPFPLNDLAPDHARSRALPYNPPTPPPDEDGFEEMDWTPSQQPLQPIMENQLTISSTMPQPSPFYGRLPPAPLSQAHKLRNPPNQPTFRQATDAQKQSFFSRRRSRLDRDSISEASTECFDSPTKTINQSEVASPRFAEPRFFPPSDYERDTGLESIFSNAFSIAEEPHELRVARELKQQQLAEQRSRDSASKRLKAFSFVALAFSFLAWIFAPSIPLLTGQIRLMCLTVAAVVAGRGLIETIRRDKVYWRWSDMFIYSLELCSSVFLGKASSNLPPERRGKDIDELSMAGIVFLGIMFLQELWIWISKLEPSSKAPVSVSVSGAPSQNSPPLITNPAPTTTTTTTINKLRVDEPSSPKKQDDKQAHPPNPNSSVPSSDRITRSKSRRETTKMMMSPAAAATNGLGSLSLGGGGGSGGGAGGSPLDLLSRGNVNGNGNANGIRSRRK